MCIRDRVEEKEKNWRNAVANYQQVIEIVPDHKEALIVLALSLIHISEPTRPY